MVSQPNEKCCYRAVLDPSYECVALCMWSMQYTASCKQTQLSYDLIWINRKALLYSESFINSWNYHAAILPPGGD